MAGRSNPPFLKRGVIFILVVALVIVLDQLSKELVRANLPLGGSLPEVCRTSIVHVQNSGSIFGLFANQTFLLTIMSIAGLLVILMFYCYLTEFGVLGRVALGLIFGGAIGNLIDRVRIGYVTDFIYVRLWGNVHWPAFNVADSAISIGSITLAIFFIIVLRKENAHKPRDKG